MIITKNLTKKYGDFTAVNNLNFEVKSGEILCVLGANGAGKSTTINMLLNFINPTEGEAFINDVSVTKEPIKTKEYITYIPENLMLYKSLTAIENLDYFLKLSGKQVAQNELPNFLSEAGLQQEAHHRRVSTFSKGMRQKVGIALAIAKNAKVLLLDEPTSGLDPKSSNEFCELLLKMKANGVAILMATHDLFRAKEIATHIIIMRNGEIQKQTPAEAISIAELEKTYIDIMNFKHVSHA